MPKQIKIILTIIVLAFTFGLGWEAGHRDIEVKWQNYNPKLSVINREVPQNKEVDFSLFWETWDELSKRYIDKEKLDPEKMVQGAISGMVRSVGDPYTAFYTPEQNKKFNEEIDGTFEGVGIQLGFRKNRLVVIAPLKGTPAEKAGVRAGDYIIAIGDKDTVDMTIPEAVSLIKGPKGTSVKLTFARDGVQEPITKEITRDTIKVKSVELTMRDDNIAYIKLVNFGETTNAQWNEAVDEIVAKQPKSVILDLRGNPGGLLQSAIHIASEFLKPGSTVLKEEYADGKGATDKTNHTGKLQDIKLVVLIDEGSASASEIVAGSLLENKRAELVGKKSFGKGTVQQVEDLPKGSSLHVTVAKWLLPSGESIDKIGVKPAYEVDLKTEDWDNNRDPQLDKAVSLVK